MRISLYRQNKETILNLKKMEERNELTDRQTWSRKAEIMMFLPYGGIILLSTIAVSALCYFIYVV